MGTEGETVNFDTKTNKIKMAIRIISKIIQFLIIANRDNSQLEESDLTCSAAIDLSPLTRKINSEGNFHA